MSESTVSRVYDKARKATFTPEEYASPLARRPYDLRHPCVSFWLAVGVPSAQVAEWAGHSVYVLHQIYAAVIAGLEHAARMRIERGLAAFEYGPGGRLTSGSGVGAPPLETAELGKVLGTDSRKHPLLAG